jgi:predicted NBD/HSP70 family sugar kinase
MLKPEVSIPVALATGVLVWGIYANVTPTMLDLRAAPPNDEMADGARKSAAWTSAAAVAGISLIAKDPVIFIVGGAFVIMADWLTRHNIAVNPDTGRATLPSNRRAATMSVEDPTAMDAQV